MKTKYAVPAVDKALAILEYASGAGRAVSQAELCRAVDVSQTTGYRIVQSLCARNWLRKTGNGLYTLSTALLSVYSGAQKGGLLFAGAQAELDALAHTTRLTCKLSLRQGHEQLTLLRGESPEDFAVTGKKGARFPLIEGSVGAALLADATDDELAALLRIPTADIEEARSPSLLHTRIAEVRERGWTLNTGAGRGTGVALSMPIRDSQGRVLAALTLLGLKDDFSPASLPSLVEALTHTVTALQSTL